MSRTGIDLLTDIRGDSKNAGRAPMKLGLREISRSIARRVAMAGCAVLLTAGLARAQSDAAGQDAWSAIQNNPEFSDAAALFEYAGLVQYVQTDRFTAFIPTNAAFDSHPGVLAGLLRERTRAFPDTTLAVIFVRSHAIYDLHPLSEFSGRTATLTSISGNPITVDGTVPGKYTVTWVSVQSEIATARIVDKPIMTSNAVIYPVDTVVLMNP